MFICLHDHVSEPGEPETRVVLEKRERVYENGGVGWEIVSEGRLCPKHAAEWVTETPVPTK